MLTNAQARDAKPRSIRYEITCDAMPGFILRVLPTGKKVFFARYRGPDGKDHRQRIGLMGPGLNAEEARREAMAILARRADRSGAHEQPPAPRTPVLAPAAGPKSPTLAEFACRFEHEHIDMYLKPDTASHYRSSLRRFIIPALGERRLSDITPADVQRLHNSLKSIPCSANLTRCVLSCLFITTKVWNTDHGYDATMRAFDASIGLLGLDALFVGLQFEVARRPHLSKVLQRRQHRRHELLQPLERGPLLLEGSVLVDEERKKEV